MSMEEILGAKGQRVAQALAFRAAAAEQREKQEEADKKEAQIEKMASTRSLGESHKRHGSDGKNKQGSTKDSWADAEKALGKKEKVASTSIHDASTTKSEARTGQTA